MANVEIADSDLAELKRIVMGGLRDFNVQVYLFGSYARGNPHRCSDIDVGVGVVNPSQGWSIKPPRSWGSIRRMGL
jgi:predicted nucleotidyltransferase